MNIKNPFKGGKPDAASVIVGVIGGLLAGSGAGYILCRRHLADDFSRRLDAEVAEVKAHYNERAKVMLETGSPYVGPSAGDLASQDEDGDDRSSTLGTDDEVRPADVDGTGDYHTDVPGEGSPTGPVHRNAFITAERDTEKPHRISIQEFSETPEGAQALQITYYAGDNILLDDQNKPIPDIVGTVGELNALSFGGISGDPHICYVRNPYLEIDFEIVLVNGKYTEEILGYGNPNREQ